MSCVAGSQIAANACAGHEQGRERRSKKRTRKGRRRATNRRTRMRQTHPRDGARAADDGRVKRLSRRKCFGKTFARRLTESSVKISTAAQLMRADTLAPAPFFDKELTGFSIDTRTRVEGDEELQTLSDRLLLVDDVIDALQAIARGVLEHWDGQVVGI